MIPFVSMHTMDAALFGLTGRADSLPVLVGVADEVGISAPPPLAAAAAGRACLALEVLKVLGVKLVCDGGPVGRRLGHELLPLHA